MKHQIIYKNKNRYSSFPLLKQLDDRILIGFFTAPVSDHMGLFQWYYRESFDQSETWHICNPWKIDSGWNWPTNSPREKSDMFTFEFESVKIATGSYGFKIGKDKTLHKSTSLFYRSSPDNWQKEMHQRFYEIPSIDIILTFPRTLQFDNLILIPAYAILKNGLSRCLVWRSEDYGQTFGLWNMFPDGIDGNEMAFVDTEKGILAHIRSDKHPYLMESWSYDIGITWTYPTLVYCKGQNNIVGGPPHLLRLKDDRILCSYGYRFDKMGIRAIISEDEGETWNKPIILREDGGYLSSLHKKKWFKKLPGAGNDVGYPVSIELDDSEILTAYYITNLDKITHIATTKWGI